MQPDKSLSSAVDTGRAAAAAALAGSAYLASVWLDRKLSSYPYNDLKLTGQILTTRSPWWQLMGTASHYAFSVSMALLYARFGYGNLPGSPWLRGVAFMMCENALLYPLLPAFEKVHAGRRERTLPTLLCWKGFKGQVVRHLAFGVVLGLVYRPERDM